MDSFDHDEREKRCLFFVFFFPVVFLCFLVFSFFSVFPFPFFFSHFSFFFLFFSWTHPPSNQMFKSSHQKRSQLVPNSSTRVMAPRQSEEGLEQGAWQDRSLLMDR